MDSKKRELLIEENIQFHKDNGYPHFGPYNGICRSCGGNLVELYGDGYRTAFITGCRICGISYCD